MIYGAKINFHFVSIRDFKRSSSVMSFRTFNGTVMDKISIPAEASLDARDTYSASSASLDTHTHSRCTCTNAYVHVAPVYILLICTQLGNKRTGSRLRGKVGSFSLSLSTLFYPRYIYLLRNCCIVYLAVVRVETRSRRKSRLQHVRENSLPPQKSRILVSCKKKNAHGANVHHVFDIC